jgi:endo-1,4-beta-mannosidase
MPLYPVSFDGQYFTANEKRFLPVGAHWVPAKAALQWPYRWDKNDIEADFVKMQDLGFNIMRFDLFWAWFEPRPGNYNPEAFRQFDFFIQLANKYFIYLHPALFIGNEVGEAYWDVPWRNGRHPHADPAMLRLQPDHASEFARRYPGEAAILAWDLTDEPPYWIVSDSTTDDMATNWTRLITGALRRYDPKHLICVGTDVQDLSHGPFRPDIIVDEVDFFTVHPYPIYLPHLFPDPMLSERATYCGTFQTLLSSGAGKPTVIHELGASSAQYTPELIAQYDRVTLYSSLSAGAIGFIPWCYTDAAPETYHRVPYLRAPHETQFGLTTWDKKDRPAGIFLRDFSNLLARLDLTGLKPAPAEAALIIPHEWAKNHGDYSKFGLTGPEVVPFVSIQDGWNDDANKNNDWLMGALLSAFILGKRADLNVSIPREYTQWQTHPLLLLPSPLTSTDINLVHVHTIFWEKAHDYVSEGGVLYASFCSDAAIPNMAALFGASLSDHIPVEDVSLTLTTDFGNLPAGETFHFLVDPTNQRQWPVTLDIFDGQVIAEDQDGRPAMVTHTLGTGKTLLSAYPLEHYLAITPSAFEGDEKTHQLYRALWEWAGVQPLFSSGHPSVEMGALTGSDRGYVIVTNHSAESQTVTVTSRQNLTSASIVTANGYKHLQLQGNTWKMEIPAYDGSIIEWKI